MNRLLAATAAALLLAPAARAADPGAFLVAQFASHKGDMLLASSSMQTAMAADPTSTELREDAFILSLVSGSPDALGLAHTLPQNPMAELLLATQSARDGNWQAAELGFAELPHQPLSDAMRPLLMAWAQQAQGFADRAMDTLQPALAGGKLGAISLLHAALIADAGHRDGLAQRLYADLKQAQTQPSLQFGQILANWQARAGDQAGARATIDAVVQSTPELAISKPGLLAALTTARPPTAQLGIALAFLQVAAALRTQEGHDVAGLLVQLSLLLEPGMTDARLLAAEIATGRHQQDLAIMELEKIPASDPLAPVVQMRLANLYEHDGRQRDATALLQKLISAYPDRPEPLTQLGDTMVDQKRFPDAIAAYDRAIAMVRHPAASDWVLFYARGTALERAHEWPRAQEDMNRALELQPDQPYVLNFLGYAMADRNQNLPEARQMIEKALTAKPNDGAIVDSLGWVKLRQGETKDALRLLEKAAELEPEDPSITGHLGDAYWDAGRRIEAEDQWRRALVLKPDPDDLARIQARLKEVEK